MATGVSRPKEAGAPFRVPRLATFRDALPQFERELGWDVDEPQV